MNLNIFFDSFTSIITTPIGFLYVLIFTQNWRYKRKKMQVIFISFFTCIIFANILMLSFLGLNDFTRILIAFSNSAACFILLLLTAKFERGKLFFSFFSALIFVFISNTISSCLLPVQMPYYLPVKAVLKIGVDLLSLTILQKYFASPYASTTDSLNIHWGKITLLPVSICLLFYLMVVDGATIYSNPAKVLPLLMLCVVSIIIYITLYYLFSDLQHQTSEKENKRVFKAQVEILENQLKHISEQEKATSFLNHDIRHYAQIIAACIRNEQYQEALEAISSLFHQLDQKSASLKKKNYCEHPIINVSIGYWIQKAEELGIQVFTKLNISPDISIDAMDLAIVLSNSMENAINACQKLSTGSTGRIVLTAQIVGKQLFIEIGNSYSGIITFDPKTNLPLTNSPGHGIGTQSISAFVRKYNAVMSYNAQDGWFTLRMLI